VVKRRQISAISLASVPFFSRVDPRLRGVGPNSLIVVANRLTERENKAGLTKFLVGGKEKKKEGKNVLVNANFTWDCSRMKTTPLVLKCVAGAVGIVLLSAPGLMANTNSDQSKNMPTVIQQRAVPRERVILVQTTESRIPKRVVVAGTQVNGASPMYVVQSRDLIRTGATDITGLLRIDPSITVRRH
jgi:hypothetical protein